MLQRSKQFLVFVLTIGLLAILAPVASAATVTDDAAVVTATSTDDVASSQLEPTRRDDDDDDGDDDDDDDADACGDGEAFLVLEVPNLLCLEIPPN